MQKGKKCPLLRVQGLRIYIHFNIFNVLCLSDEIGKIMQFAVIYGTSVLCENPWVDH